MQKSNTVQKNDYLKELTLNLCHEGFTTSPEENGILPVMLDDQQLCQITDQGRIRYRKEDVADDTRSAALERATAIAQTTAEYMRQMETAPLLTASGLTGDYRLLADFNDTVLTGHPTRYGVQFITWDRTQDCTALYQGNYYGPSTGVRSYAAAKQDFVIRSGLIPESTLFSLDQLMEIYHCSTEALAGTCPVTEERQEYLQSIIEQIERSIPDLSERLRQEQSPADIKAPEIGGMQFS